MSGSRILRRLRRHPLVLVAAVVVLASGFTATGLTFASFTAETQNSTSTLAGGWVGTASNLSISASGYDAQLAWTPGTHGVTGQQLWGYDNGSSSTCPSSGYTQLASMASATTSSYTQSNGTSGSLNGHDYCYRMVATSSSSWTGTASFPVVQLGLVATGIAIANGSSSVSGEVDDGDTITITFNQAPTGITTGTGLNVCVNPGGNTNVIVLGDTGTCSSTSDANDTGVISGFTLSGGGGMGATAAVVCNNSTFAIAGSTLTITVGSVGGMGSPGPCSTSPATISGGPGTYTPASSILSATTTDQASICTSATYGCKPTTTGSF